MFFHSLETGIGYSVVLWFQSWRTGFVSSLFLPFNYLFNEISFLILLPLIYWCFQKDAGKRLMQMMLVSFLINIWFKAFWARPRPYQVTVPGKPAVVPALTPLISHGIPSGHTQGAVTLFGFFAREVKNKFFTITMILLMLLTGLSRLVHGMHYPEDVLAGALLGTAVLFLYPALRSLFEVLLKSLALPAKVFLALLFLGVLLFVFKITIPEQKAFQSYAALASVYTFGLNGFSLESRYIRFSTRGGAAIKILRFLFGFLLTGILYLGLKVLFTVITADPQTTLFTILRIIRYALVGLWVSAGAPALFIKLRLSRRI